MNNNENIILIPRHAEVHHTIPQPYKIQRNFELCINCGTCISVCIYDCHHRKSDDERKMDEPKSNLCRRCFACILRCPRKALSLTLNEDYLKLGNNKSYTPEVIVDINSQALDGKVPVSGSGYGGKFDGPRYDSIWTDMSEIIRPTRDGIHGREHISTTINLGRKLSDICGLSFDEKNISNFIIPQNREIPIPILFGNLPFGAQSEVLNSMAIAANQLNTLMVVTPQDILKHTLNSQQSNNDFLLKNYFNNLIIKINHNDIMQHQDIISWASMIEIEYNENYQEIINEIHKLNSQVITIITIKADNKCYKNAENIIKQGGEIIHIKSGINGIIDEMYDLIDILSQTHKYLVNQGIRDQITILASGGIAQAEHIAKTIILGADGVLIDIPILIALECTVCGNCQKGLACPQNIGNIDSKWTKQDIPYYHWGATRIINLMLSWKNQLLEILGAMGIRDVRRLRGETGRAIFAKELKKEFITLIQSQDNNTYKDLSDTNRNFLSFSSLNNKDNNITPKSTWRFAQELSIWQVKIDRTKCTNCGLCVISCKFNVHSKIEGKNIIEEPKSSRCIGISCQQNDWCCINICPWKAISVEKSSYEKVLGDYRWPADLLIHTFMLANTPKYFHDNESENIGISEGGFDIIKLVAHTQTEPKVLEHDVDLSISLNKRTNSNIKINIPIPIYGGGMSYGSISLPTMLGRAKAAKYLGTMTSTGEGGYPDELLPYKDYVITQIATGLFGVREETIKQARMVEIKYAQGAKPGLGGHLLGEKNTKSVAKMREAVEGTSLFSPFPFHSVYSVEDHKKHLDWIRSIHPDVIISVKVSTPSDVDMVAVGSYYAGANVINIDGSYGGTGAAPNIAKKNIAMPIEYAINKVHKFLNTEGIRDQIVLIASGGIRSADDVLKAIALGADGVMIGTAELVAIGCVRCKNCERGRGCPLGIATTDDILTTQLDSDWVAQRIINLYLNWAQILRKKLAKLGLKSIQELVGKTYFLKYINKNG